MKKVLLLMIISITIFASNVDKKIGYIKVQKHLIFDVEYYEVQRKNGIVYYANKNDDETLEINYSHVRKKGVLKIKNLFYYFSVNYNGKMTYFDKNKENILIIDPIAKIYAVTTMKKFTYELNKMKKIITDSKK
jgi:hypothetical protein